MRRRKWLDDHGASTRLRRIWGLVALGTLAVGSVSCGASRQTSTAPTTSASSTSGTGPSTTSVATSLAVWPPTDSPIRYTDPVAAAQAFATGYVGFVDPVVGPFRQGDSRSGEVDVRPSASGPATIVLVRQLSSDTSWSVIGATTANIRVDGPAALTEIASPVALKGTSSAFEGTVQTEIRQDGMTEPLGKGFVTGGSGEMGPFSGSVGFSHPTARAGALLLYTVSTENGHIWEAGVLRIRFAQS